MYPLTPTACTYLEEGPVNHNEMDNVMNHNEMDDEKNHN
jgi:hypothetical protein